MPAVSCHKGSHYPRLPRSKLIKAILVVCVSNRNPKTLITMDVCSQAVFRKEHLRMLESHDSPVSRYLVEAIDPWLKLNRKVFFRAQGFFPWDVVAAAYLIDKTLFDENPCSLSIQKTGLRSGRVDKFRLTDSRQAGEAVVSVIVHTKLYSEGFMRLLIDGLLRFRS